MFPLVIYVAILPAGLEGYGGNFWAPLGPLRLPGGLHRGYWDWAPLRPQQLHGGLNYGGQLGIGFGSGFQGQRRRGQQDMSSGFQGFTWNPTGGIPSKCWEAPAVVGRCRARWARWSYTASRGCFEFNYGGCEGTGNNFGSFSECMATCAQRCSEMKK